VLAESKSRFFILENVCALTFDNKASPHDVIAHDRTRKRCLTRG